MSSDLGEWVGLAPSLRKEMAKICQCVKFSAVYTYFVQVDLVLVPWLTCGWDIYSVCIKGDNIEAKDSLQRRLTVTFVLSRPKAYRAPLTPNRSRCLGTVQRSTSRYKAC